MRQILGQAIEERVDVPLVVAPEREAELHLLDVRRRDPAVGARGRGRFLGLLPAHVCLPLRQQKACCRTIRITNATRRDRSSPIPGADRWISARRSTGSVTSSTRSRACATGRTAAGESEQMAHDDDPDQQQDQKIVRTMHRTRRRVVPGGHRALSLRRQNWL
jgi:hypothetical protein